MGLFAIVKNGNMKEVSFDDNLKDTFLEKYDDLVLEDYNLICKTGNCFYVDIAKNVTLEDYKKIMGFMANISREDEVNMEITNHVVRNGVDDEDVFDYGHIKYIMDKHREKYSDEKYNKILDNRRPIKVLDIFLRKKLNLLNDEEKDMYDKYENFNLDTLLFDEDNDSLTLNTDNSGFISIFKDNIYESTNTKDAHSYSREKHEKLYNMDHPNNNEKPIEIHVFKGVMAIKMNENINDYQVKKLDEIINEVDDLCKFHNKDIMVEAGFFTNNGEIIGHEYNGLNEVKEMLHRRESDIRR